MPNNILIGSEKLFRTKAPWRINHSFLGQLSQDHHLLLFDIKNNKDIQYKRYLTKLSRTLFDLSQTNTGHLTFVGIGDDSRVLCDLYEYHGFEFDCAVLVNNNQPTHIFDQVLTSGTKLYNFWTKNMNFQNHIIKAEINEFVKTTLPAHMSNRLAMEISGCLTYDGYQQNYLDSNYSKITFV